MRCGAVPSTLQSKSVTVSAAGMGSMMRDSTCHELQCFNPTVACKCKLQGKPTSKHVYETQIATLGFTIGTYSAHM